MIEKLNTYLDDITLLLESLFDPDPRWTEEEKIGVWADAVWALFLIVSIIVMFVVLVYVIFIR